MESWAIDLHKEYFKFSCAHFLIFPDGSKERLHGHNYHVQVELAGQLTDRGIVMDFNHAKPIVRELCDALDEHWLGGSPAHSLCSSRSITEDSFSSGLLISEAIG